MKQFNCDDVVPGCDWVTQAEGEREILVEISAHAREEHGMDEVPPEVAETIRAAIRDV